MKAARCGFALALALTASSIRHPASGIRHQA
jgi:hypothetical protein